MITLRTITHDPRQWLALNIQWLRWPIILAVLLVVAALAGVVDGRNALYLLLILFAIPALLLGSYVLLRWMAIGFILLAPTNMLVPLAIGTGSETSINATILLILGMTGLWLFDMINNQRRVWIHRSRPILPLLLMLVTTCISFLAGQLPWFSVSGSSLSAQIGGLAIFIISACAFLLAAHHIHTIRWLEWITWSFIIVGALFVIPGLFPPLLRLTGRFIQTGSYSSQFWTWFIIIAFSQAWLNRKLHKGLRGGLLASCAAGLYIVLVTENEWKSGWIPPLVGIATIIALYSWKFFGLMGIAGLLALPVALSRLIAADEYSYGTRVDAWIILGEIIKVSPILGLGPSNYYWYTPLFAIRGYSVKFNSHNQYVDLLAQIGIVGTLIVLWFFAEVAALGWKLLRVAPEGFPKAYVYGALGGLVATLAAGMLGDWFLPFVYNVGMVGMRSSILGWVFLGALVAMEQMYLVEKVDSEQVTVNSE
jgi:hypothetical protein